MYTHMKTCTGKGWFVRLNKVSCEEADLASSRFNVPLFGEEMAQVFTRIGSNPTRETFMLNRNSAYVGGSDSIYLRQGDRPSH